MKIVKPLHAVMKRFVIAGFHIIVISMFLHAGCTHFKITDDHSAQSMAFSIQLADTPGPGGHPLTYTPWMITQGEKPYGLAFCDEESIIAKGETDSNGYLVFDDTASRKLDRVLSNPSVNVWLVYPGQVVQMFKMDVSPAWTDDMRLFYWLKSESFFKEINAYNERVFQSEAGKEQLRYAMELFQAKDRAALIKMIDLPVSGSVIYFDR